MESHARHILIGLFLLLATFVGFGFVYWLQNNVGLQQSAAYRIRFQSPVLGLKIGAAVVFNGIRVGQITALRLDSNSPKDVTATILVAHDTPIRADTEVGTEVQGLMGAPVLSLKGASSSAPFLSASPGEIPTLVAGPSATRDVMQSARETLRTVDRILIDNAEPLHETVQNLKTFSGALARNSDRLDTIVDGLARMLAGPAKANPRIHDLPAPRDFPERIGLPSGQLAIAEPSTVVALDTQRILLRSEQGGSAAFPDDQWADTVPKLFQARVIQAFENAQFTGIAKASESFNAEHELQIDIRTFHISATAQPTAEIEFSAKIVQNGRVSAARIFRATVSFSDVDPGPATNALSAAFTNAVTDLVVWSLDVIG